MRSLSGERAQRIVEAMRESVAEVGIAGSTFDRVSRKAGVSRGLLHYYFGTKERLLVEVIRRDTDYRLETLGTQLRAARTVDELIAAFFDTFSRTLQEKGYVFLVSELFVAGRNQPDVLSELGALYGRARSEFAEILREKEREGVVRLRFGAEAVLAYLFAAGDGLSVQLLSDPTIDADRVGEVSLETARFLLDARN
ncbi:MAG TPA: TetR/AcrR family transcriptional regulator [Solirubrobacterales bacterium]|nr:TetR/AcrR family transcriptional regulator [Solirubrobacterales bacterium]